MKKSLLAVLFGIALVLGACGGGGDDGASEEPADTNDDAATEESSDGGEAVDTAAGEEIYQANCSSCHGADLSGGAGPDLTQVGSDHTVDEIKDIVTNGQGSMPPGLVEGEDLDVLANWLVEEHQ